MGSQVQNDHKLPEKVKRYLLIVSGEPGVGKSLTVENTGVLFREYLGRLNIDAKQFRSRTRTWEKDGEAASRRAGEIQTPRGTPLEDWELEKVNNRLKITVAKSLINNISTIVEVPGISVASLIDGVWEGRDLGSTLQYAAETREPPFDKVPDYEVAHVSLIGSTFLRSIIGFSRWDYRNAPDLPAARYVAGLYGMRIPRTTRAWQRSTDGAVGPELELIDSVVINLAESLRRKRKIFLPIGRHESIGDRLKRELKEYQLDLVGALKREKDFRSRVEYEIANYFFTQIVQVEPERLFLGFNKPTPKNLGIDDIKAVAERFREISLMTLQETPKVA